MLGIVLAAGLAAASPLPLAPQPQDTGTVDAPVYESAEYAVSIPRPFDDWVFEPGQGRPTQAVIFHPRGVPLDGQLWGALILTAYPGRASLARVADQRVEVAWRPQLGASFELLSRESTRVAGYAAVRLVLRGSIGGVELRAEEYVIARRRDLVVLQFRYPGTVSGDSLAAGYRRVLDGLRLAPRPAVTTRAAPPAAEHPAPSGVHAWSPWQARAYDAQVRYDSARLRADFTVRMELVNDGPVPADSVAVWLWPVFALDSVRTATATLRLPRGGDGGVSRPALPVAVEPQGTAALTYFYHLGAEAVALPPTRGAFAADGAYLAFDWLPRVQPAEDSAGQVVQVLRPRFTLSFDVPASWRAVAPGRMTADLEARGRRRTTWSTEDVAATTPAFALGPFRVVPRRSDGLGVVLWLAPDDAPSDSAVNALMEAVRGAWIFCSRAFGRLPIADVNIVSTRMPETRGFLGLIISGGLVASPAVIVREVARSWWGNAVDAAGPGSWWVRESFPAWTAIAAQGKAMGDTLAQRLVREAEAGWRSATAGNTDAPLAGLAPDTPSAGLLLTKGVAALEAARRAVGEIGFREAMLGLALGHRDSWVTAQDILGALGPDAQAVLRPLLF